jgi:molybdopterin-synthase adenylyltransferase
MERYCRQLILPEIGKKGQTQLSLAKVLVIGAGGLGSPACFYLAAAGVGNVGIVDSDQVELSNLNRQIIHSTKDLKISKVKSAKAKIQALNPDIYIKIYQERFSKENASAIIKNYDFVIDATDNFESKFLINDICLKEKKAFSHAGILGFEGQTMTVIPEKTACYRCVFVEQPKINKKKLGVFGVTPGIIGTIQAAEAMKYILKKGELLINKILKCNVLNMEFRVIEVKKNKRCLCGDKK